MKKVDCIFCNAYKDIPLLSNSYAYARFDGYPVTDLHVLIIPVEHYETYFDMPDEVKHACWNLVDEVRVLLRKQDSKITGFNVGFNCGLSAGQSIPHAHIHVIPRRDWDMKNPKGGVRHVIPEKGSY